MKTSLPTRADLHVPSSVNVTKQVSFFENEYNSKRRHAMSSSIAKPGYLKSY
jgi:hypothetical protein